MVMIDFLKGIVGDGLLGVNGYFTRSHGVIVSSLCPENGATDLDI